jgi:hypothetical protein
LTTGERIFRIAVRSIAGLLLAAILLWPADWAVWRVRVAFGGGMGQVTVSRFTIAALKGNKDDYYYEGTGPVDCSQSLFQHAGEGACWYLRKHPELMVRY